MQQKSILTKFYFLEKVYASPTSFSKEERDTILLACKNQHSLAKLSDDNHGLVATSLNTMKSQANNELRNGFISLDQLRKNVLLKLETCKQSSNKATRGSKAALIEKIAEQQKVIEKLNDNIASLTVKLDEIMKFFYSTSMSNAQLEKFKRFQHEIFIKFDH
jgi:hypothetical protein